MNDIINFFIIYFLTYLGFILKLLSSYEYKDLEKYYLKNKKIKKILIKFLKFDFKFPLLIFYLIFILSNLNQIIFVLNYLTLALIFFQNAFNNFEKKFEFKYLIFCLIILCLF